MTKIVRLLVGVAVVAWGGQVSAGYRGGRQEVVISTAGLFYGRPSDARSSADSNQWIGCQVNGQAGNTSGYCYAVDAAGTNKYCVFSRDAGVAAALATLTPSSMLYVYFDADNTCYNVTVGNFSYAPPLAP